MHLADAAHAQGDAAGVHVEALEHDVAAVLLRRRLVARLQELLEYRRHLPDITVDSLCENVVVVKNLVPHIV